MSKKEYKGIILAGGNGTRLRPLTDFICKQLLPIYEKPLIYYPLTNLILAGIKDILIISTPRDIPILENAIGNGSSLGIKIEYMIQKYPKGLAEAFILGKEFIQDHPVCMILGDNILYKANFSIFFKSMLENNIGATVFSFPVKDPKRFGIIEVDKEDNNSIVSIEEKPLDPKSNLAVIGLYIYNNTVVKKAQTLVPSERGELEITALNNLYLKERTLHYSKLSRSDMWIDVGTFDAFSQASQLIYLIETRLGLKIGCPEEASYNMHNISAQELLQIAKRYSNSEYGEYLKSIIS